MHISWMRWLNCGIVLTKWITNMTYTVIDKDRMRKLKHFEKCRRNPLKGYSGILLVSHTTDIYKIPENSTIQRRGNVWEIHLPEDFKKSKKILAKTLDAIAYM